jgi:hypothetical protein
LKFELFLFIFHFKQDVKRSIDQDHDSMHRYFGYDLNSLRRIFDLSPLVLKNQFENDIESLLRFYAYDPDTMKRIFGNQLDQYLSSNIFKFIREL